MTMNRIDRNDPVERFEHLFVRALEWVVAACFAVLAGLVVVLVVMRYAFNTTIIGGNEVTEYLFIYTTALGAAVSVARNQHIRIGVFVQSLPRRAGLLVDAFAVALVLVLHIGLLVLSADWITAVGGFDFPILNIPQGIVQVAVPIGCAGVIVFCATRLVALARAFRSPG